MNRFLCNLLAPGLLLSMAFLPLSAQEQPPEAVKDPLGYWAEHLANKQPEKRLKAVFALRELGPRAQPATLALANLLRQEKDARFKRAVVCALGDIGPGAAPAVPALIEALSDQGHDVASWSASALGQIGPGAKAAVPALITLVRSNESGRAYSAAVALGRIGPNAKAAVPELLRHLDMRHWIAPNAAEALWRITRHPKALPALIEQLHDPKNNDRGAAALSLGQIGPDAKVAVPALLKALDDRQNLMPTQVPEALWRIEKHPKAIPALLAELKGPDSTLRCQAASALGRIGPEAKAAVPGLIEALKDRADWVAPTAADALKRVAPEAAKKAGVK